MSSEEYAEFLRYKKAIEYEMDAITISDKKQINKIRKSTGPKDIVNKCGSNVRLMIDTGAPVNVIDENTFNHLANQHLAHVIPSSMGTQHRNH